MVLKCLDISINKCIYAKAYATDIRRISIDDIKEAILEFGAVYKTFYYSNEIILTHK